MQPTPDFSAPKLAKSLLRRRREGALATLMQDDGAPYCSLVNLASHPDGSPLLLISRLAIHTRNVLADPRVSLMLDERAAGDPLEGARIMLLGRAVPARPDELPLWRRRYLAAHPAAEGYIDFADFSLFRIETSGLHLVAGFGRILDLSPDRYLTDLTGAGALLEVEASAVEHINADHSGTMKLYATQLLGAAEADWRCTGIDPEGLDLQCARQTLRLDFPGRVETSVALRDMLKRMADIARKAE
ncbi:MAG: HugZ family protein [Pseudomonadota bacterium]